MRLQKVERVLFFCVVLVGVEIDVYYGYWDDVCLDFC